MIPNNGEKRVLIFCIDHVCVSFILLASFSFCLFVSIYIRTTISRIDWERKESRERIKGSNSRACVAIVKTHWHPISFAYKTISETREREREREEESLLFSSLLTKVLFDILCHYCLCVRVYVWKRNSNIHILTNSIYTLKKKFQSQRWLSVWVFVCKWRTILAQAKKSFIQRAKTWFEQWTSFLFSSRFVSSKKKAISQIANFLK